MSASDPQHSSFIRLCDITYPVRVLNGVRLIRTAQGWVTIEIFLSALEEAGEWDKLTALALLGHGIVSERISA